MDIDLFNNTTMKRLMNERAANNGSETLTETGIDVTGRNGRAIAIAMVEMDANAAAADTVLVTIEKCTAADGTGAVTLATFATFTGTGSAQELSTLIAVPISGYGGIASTHMYLRAKAVIVDANSSGTYAIAVAITLPGKRYAPENTG